MRSLGARGMVQSRLDIDGVPNAGTCFASACGRRSTRRRSFLLRSPFDEPALMLWSDQIAVTGLSSRPRGGGDLPPPPRAVEYPPPDLCYSREGGSRELGRPSNPASTKRTTRETGVCVGSVRAMRRSRVRVFPGPAARTCQTTSQPGSSRGLRWHEIGGHAVRWLLRRVLPRNVLLEGTCRCSSLLPTRRTLCWRRVSPRA